jgi:hypothetical protein
VEINLICSNNLRESKENTKLALPPILNRIAGKTECVFGMLNLAWEPL